MSVANVEPSPAAERGAGGAGQELRPEEIAVLLERWRPAVLRQMRRRRLWRGAPSASLEDQFQDVALVLCGRQFHSHEHLRRALWTGLGFRARDYWKSVHREIPVAEIFEERKTGASDEAVEDEAATAADRRALDDCLSELDPRERAVYRLIKGDELSRRKAAKALSTTEADVLRALYSAEQKLDRVVLLLVNDRLCARRAEAVASLARAQARGSELEQARAHLAHCRPCLLAFREQHALLGRRLVAALPAPALAHALDGRSPDAPVELARQLGRAAKRYVYVLSGRAPKSAPGAEAVIGGGAAGAVGAKIAVGLCLGAAVGAGALCVNTVGLFPPPERTPATARPHHVRASEVPSPPATPPVEQTPAPAAAPSAGPPAQPQPRPTPALPPPPPQPQEFFGIGSAPRAGTSKSSRAAAAHGASNGSGAAARSGSGSAPSKGGPEFFGG